MIALTGLACSQRVTPEEEFAREGRDRPLASASSMPAPMRAAPVASGDAVRGRIVVPEDAGDALETGILFVLVRPEGAAGGPPLAVQRHQGVTSPVEFAIGPADAMIAGTSFPERVTVTARLDADGDPLTSGPGDWSATSAPVAPGATGIELDLAEFE